MPSMAARSIATTFSPSRSVAPAVIPARRNAVPQIGPEVPPIREVIIIPVFFRKVPSRCGRVSSQLASTFSKPRASE